jgi:tetratricopeptide (TPR) repeat protein
MNPTQPLDPQHLPSELEQRKALASELGGLARAAQARGELLTAMLHASDALMLFPNERPFLDLVDEVALSAADPLSLVPVASGSVHVATAAARARILMMKKEMPAAIELLAEVVLVAPDLAYLPWVQRWLQQPGVVARFRFEQLGPSVVRAALRIGSALPVPADPSDPRLPNVRAGAEIFTLLRAQFPDESVLYFGEVLLRRRLGDVNASLAVAQAGVQRFPRDARLQISMLNALRDAKRPDEALAHARQALELDPSDGAPLYDAAWAFADAGRAQDGVRVLEELLARFPDYPSARAAFHALRFRASGAHEDRVALVTLREREWWNTEAVGFANEVDPVRAYLQLLAGARRCDGGGRPAFAPRARGDHPVLRRRRRALGRHREPISGFTKRAFGLRARASRARRAGQARCGRVRGASTRSARRQGAGPVPPVGLRRHERAPRLSERGSARASGDRRCGCVAVPTRDVGPCGAQLGPTNGSGLAASAAGGVHRSAVAARQRLRCLHLDVSLPSRDRARALAPRPLAERPGAHGPVRALVRPE